jgi:hypothetical protein
VVLGVWAAPVSMLHSPGPLGSWKLVRGKKIREPAGLTKQDPIPSCLPLKTPTFSSAGWLVWLVPAMLSPPVLFPPPELPLPLPLPLPVLLSRLLCILALCFGVSTSAFLCLCHCLFLFSLLLLAPVDIKVIKDLPWPPPVGQLDSSPSLPDGDRDISGPASPLPEPSLEDSSGGSFGDLWPGC